MTSSDPPGEAPRLDLLPVATGRQARAALISALGRRRAATCLALACLVGAAIATLVVPPLLGAITQTVVDDGSPGRVDLLAAGLLLTLLVNAVLTGAGRFAVARVGEDVLAELREDVVAHALTIPMAELERAGSGDLLARVGTDVDAVSDALRAAVPQLTWAVLTIALTIVGLGLLDWRLALAGLAAAPVQIVATRWYLRRARPLYAAERAAGSHRAQQLTETLSGAATVRAFRLTARHRWLVDEASASAVRRSLAAGRTGARFFAWLNGAEMIGLITTLLVGFVAVRAGTIDIGEATAAALYFHGLFNPVGSLLSTLDVAQDANASLARLVGIANLPAAPRGAPAGGGSIRLEGVTFGYQPGLPVIHDLDLIIPAGQRIAVVGASGGGKSTIAKLAAGIHEPDTGTVTIGPSEDDGPDPGGGGPAVSVVTQEIHVFAGSLTDDLRLVRPDASAGEIRTALEVVSAATWVDALPDGIDTVVGTGGHQLTGTEAQQLGLSRLALTRSPVVILDEATAEAGSAGARQLERAADAAIGDRTAIVIAHRLTQAAAADRIIVVEHGRIVEDGDHAGLLAAGGRYAALWAAWSADEPEPADRVGSSRDIDGIQT